MIHKSVPSALPPLLRLLLRAATVLALAYAAHLLMNWTSARLKALPEGESSVMLTSLLVLILAAYAVLIAIPFVPGVEIGLALLLMQGPPVAPLVYAASVAGLYLAYVVGRWLPLAVIRRTLSDLGLARAASLIDRVDPLRPEDRLSLLSDRLPAWLGRHVVRWRYLLLAVLVNFPGTTLIGGGGGIAMIAGLSRLFTPWATAVTFLVAVLPVPLGIWFFGIGRLP